MRKIKIIYIVISVLIIAYVFACPKEEKSCATNIPEKNEVANFKAYQGEYRTIDGIKHRWGRFWGYIPVQNDCPNCGKFSVTRFCTDCGAGRKERCIGVYCPKCEPDGKYTSRTDMVGAICPDCGNRKTWKEVPVRQ